MFSPTYTKQGLPYEMEPLHNSKENEKFHCSLQFQLKRFRDLVLASP